MEILLLFFGMGAAVVVAAAYCVVAAWIFDCWPRLARALIIPSTLVIVSSVVEFLLLLVSGVPAIEAVLGKAFAYLHFIVFLLLSPSVVNLLVFRKGACDLGVVAVVAGFIAAGVIFADFCGYEALFRPDGTKRSTPIQTPR
jgi:hypothetical protein